MTNIIATRFGIVHKRCRTMCVEFPVRIDLNKNQYLRVTFLSEMVRDTPKDTKYMSPYSYYVNETKVFFLFNPVYEYDRYYRIQLGELEDSNSAIEKALYSWKQALEALDDKR